MAKTKISPDSKSEKRIYVSDIHMGAGRSLNSENVYDWLGQKEAKAFADFLGYLISAGDVQEIILLGDTMDNWVCPINEVPPTFNEIIEAEHNKDIVENLRALALKEDKKVIYMPGNHDMHITGEIIRKYFPGIVFGGSAVNNSIYRTSRLLAEHGSAHAMFNAPDPVNNPGSRLPLGYFISRVVATKASKTGSADRHYWTYIDDFLEMLGPQKLPESVFEAILEEAHITENEEIKMNGSYTFKVKDIKDKYANLYEQWETYYGKGMAFKSVMAEIGYLGDLADTISKKGDTNIIIFGHSHDSEIDKDSWFVENRIYANCGSWCDKNKPYTFVETQKNNQNRIHYVRLMAWEDGAIKQLGEEHVDF